MTEREALFRIEALLEAGSYETQDRSYTVNPQVYSAIIETINIAISQGEEDAN